MGCTIRYIVILIFILADKSKCVKILMERAELTYLNPSYQEYTELNISVSKVNRTAFGLNLFLNIKKDIPESLVTRINLHGVYSNQYRPLPVEITRRTCDILNVEYQYIKHEINGKMPEKCPMTKGLYYIKDYMPNVKHAPIRKNPWYGVSKFLLILNWELHGELMITVKIYASTNDDDDYIVQ